MPMDEEPANQSLAPVQVRQVWKMTPNSSPGESARPLPLPGLLQPNIPTFVTIHTPGLLDVNSPNGSLERVPRERLEIARLEWLGRRINESLGKLDRSDQRDCELLVSSLVQFQLLVRDAERSALWNQTSPPSYRDLRIARLEERVKIAGKALTDALRNAALDEFAESARIHVGLVADDPSSSTLEIPEPNTNVRLRYLGLPQSFQGESAVKDRAPALTWTTVPHHHPFDRPLDWALIALGTLTGTLAVIFAVAIAASVRWLGPAILAIALLVLAFAAGPQALVGGLAMSWLGWMGRAT